VFHDVGAFRNRKTTFRSSTCFADSEPGFTLQVLTTPLSLCGCGLYAAIPCAKNHVKPSVKYKQLYLQNLISKKLINFIVKPSKMENQANQMQEENLSEIKTETVLVEEEVLEPIVRSKWQYIVFQILFLLGGVILFVIINYIFGFMKGN
jgi:hypothetical protein